MKLKFKICKNCGKKYEPSRPLQVVCKHTCAYEYGLKLKQKSAELSKETLTQTMAKIKHESDLVKLQQIINCIVRLIDEGCNCISCNSVLKSKANTQVSKNVTNAGHFHGVGSNNSLRYHLMNVFVQCVNCNKDKWGNGAEYSKGLIKTFGDDIFNTIIDLHILWKSNKPMNFEIKEAIKEGNVIIKELRLLNQAQFLPRLPEKRIEMRVIYNTKLNIYLT